jgi:hypothetical protein
MPWTKPWAAATPPSDADLAVIYVRELQRDGRLLLRHVARRVDRPLGDLAAGGAAGGTATSTPHVLTCDPKDLIKDQVQIRLLADTVDVLSRRAAPASANTIRLTGAYLRVAVEGGEPPPEVVARARKLKHLMRWIIGIAATATVLAVLLLAHVDDGQRAIQQLQAARREVDSTTAEMARLKDEAWVPVAAAATPMPHRAFCQEAPAEGRQPAGGPEGDNAKALCGRYAQAVLREHLAYQRIATWNGRTSGSLARAWDEATSASSSVARLVTYPVRLVGLLLHRVCDRLLSGACSALSGPGGPAAAPTLVPDPAPALVPTAGRLPFDPPQKHLLGDLTAEEHWRRTELRTASSVSLLTGFVLPLLLGCVGGCAYALRRLDQKLSEWTLELRDGSHSLLRVLLATMLGGLLGVVWSGDEPVRLEGFTLSLAAAAFFVGFSLEVVFTVIEAMVEGVAGKLRASPPVPVVVSSQLPGALPQPSREGG